MRRAWVRLSAPLAIIAGGAAFWFLSRGGIAGSAARAWAELVDHPVAPLAGGRVATVLVRVGDTVTAGQLLAVMDTRELELKREIAEIELARAHAALAAEAGIQRAAVARSELLALKLRTAQSKSQAELAQTEEELARLEKLAEQQLVPVQEVERSRLRKVGLAASVAVIDAAAKRREAGLREGAGSERASAQVEARLGPHKEEVRRRTAELRTVELAIENASLRSPAAGTVAAVLFWPGAIVASGTEVVRVATGRPGFVVAWVPERRATTIARGQAARVRPDRLLGASFGARVVEISPQMEEVPIRARSSPTMPRWGRRVVLESWPPGPLVLGEALHVTF